MSNQDSTSSLTACRRCDEVPRLEEEQRLLYVAPPEAATYGATFVKEGDAMRHIAALLVFFLFLSGAAQAQWRAEKSDNEIRILHEDTLFTAYRFGPDQKYPYLYPVIGPVSGEEMTAHKTEPYPHHSSIFFGCDKVNGANYWQDANARGQIVSEGPRVEAAEGPQVVLLDRCNWRKPGTAADLTDARRMVFFRGPNGERILDFEITLTAPGKVVIEKTNHSLFSVRMAPAFSVKQGGVLTNAEGDQGEAGTFGKPSPWCDYANAQEGLAVMQHPTNRWYPARWFTRDYGFFSPTPMYWLEGDRLEMQPGDAITLRYRVVVHAGDAQAADVAGLFQAYSAVAPL